jgi:uncharacterized membrane protein YozB (DUF420 family)
MRAQAFTSPLEASIYVEGLRARPAFFVGLLLTVHAAMWTLVAWLANPTPDPKLSVAIALGREWQFGYLDTPPLAPWILELAFRAGGLIAVYALGPFTVALTGWLIYLLARRIAGDRHGAIAVFLMVGVHPVAFPVGSFDSDIVQMPLVALAVLAWWFAVIERNRYGWIVLGVACGFFAYAGVQSFFVLAVLLGMTAAMAVGRASLTENRDQIFAVSGLFLFTLLLTPRMIWLQNHDFAGVMQLLDIPGSGIVRGEPVGMGVMVILGHIGMLLLIGLASRYYAPDGDIAPVFMRRPLHPLGKQVVALIALVPPFAAVVIAVLFGLRFSALAAAPLVLYSGLLAIVLASEALRVHRQRMVAMAALTLLFLPPVLEFATAFASPYFGATGRSTNWPAQAAARYMTDVYRTRTGKPLDYVVGSEWQASAVALASRDRPHIFIDADPAKSPWASREKLEADGGVVIWSIRGADGAPPAALAANLPSLVAESPLTLNWTRPGNLDFIRLGWAIVPPKQSGQ